MRQTFRDVPSGGERNRRRGACTNARTAAARGTWVESHGIAWMIDFAIDQESAAKCDPRPKPRMNNDPDNARAGETRQHCQLHEVQRRAVAEWIYRDAPPCSPLDRTDDLLFDNQAREIIQRVPPLKPSGVGCSMGSKGAPEISAAISNDHDRSAFLENSAGLIGWGSGDVVTFGANSRYQVQSEPLSLAGNEAKPVHGFNLHGCGVRANLILSIPLVHPPLRISSCFSSAVALVEVLELPYEQHSRAQLAPGRRSA